MADRDISNNVQVPEERQMKVIKKEPAEERIYRALGELLVSKPLHEIAVNEITEAADVSKSTFSGCFWISMMLPVNFMTV